MKDSICAIYDIDEKYAYKLMSVINTKKDMTFKMMVFTKEDALLEYLKDKGLDILIISAHAITMQIRESNIQKLIVLTEDMEDSKVAESFGGEVQSIYKYQSSDTICKEVMNYCGNTYVAKHSQAKIVGIYSPINYSYKTAFSLAYANAVGKDKKVLYVNLEEYSGLEEVLRKGDGGNLSDAIYYFKLSSDKFMEKFQSIVCKVGNFEYIAPVQCAEDVTYVSTEEWIKFIHCLGDSGLYDVVVLDISNAVREQCKILETCDMIYMSVRNDYLSQKKINSFEKYYLEIGKEQQLNNIQKIVIPYDESIRLGSGFIEHLEYSTLGSFAKGIAYE